MKREILVPDRVHTLVEPVQMPAGDEAFDRALGVPKPLPQLPDRYDAMLPAGQFGETLAPWLSFPSHALGKLSRTPDSPPSRS